MNDSYATIKELIVNSYNASGDMPPYEDITELVRRYFPTSKWNIDHYRWYKSRIKTGRIEVNAENFIDSENPSNDIDLSDEAEGKSLFALERHLRDFIAENIRHLAIGGKTLSLYVDQAGRDGIEYPTSVGFIDVLAVDGEGNFYVFELKRIGDSDRAIGQLARYMGWVKSMIGQSVSVHGVVVASRIDEKLRYAASIIPSINLFEYEVKFNLNEANEIRS